MGSSDTAAASAPSATSAARAAQRRTLGLALLLLTASIWIAASFISEALVTPQDSSQRATVHPFLLTYLATALFTVYLPFLALHPRAGRGPPEKEDEAEGLGDGHGAPESPFKGLSRAANKAAMQAALWALPLWFIAQYTFNTSLALTSVTSNTIISSTSSLFTFFLSIIFLNERFTTGKLLSILACIAGVALVTLSDSKSNDSVRSSVLGDVLTVVSSFVYAGYTVIIRLKMPAEEEGVAVAAFFGYLGLFSTVLLAPLVVLLLALDVFSLSTIPPIIYLVILLEGLIAYVLSDYLWARAILLLGPTMATLGMSIQIPMAATVELLLGHANWIHSAQTVLMMLVGTASIVGGFITLNLANEAETTTTEHAGDGQHTNGSDRSHKCERQIDGDFDVEEERLGLLASDAVAQGGHAGQYTGGSLEQANHTNHTGPGSYATHVGQHVGGSLGRESWARSVMGKLGKGRSNRSSLDSNLERKLS